MRAQSKREFTVAVFVVHEGRVLLLSHPKLGRWLPPGGHIEPDDLPDEAAVREVLEETGVHVRLFGESGVPVARPRQLIRPAGIQVEDIEPDHQHIDLIYFATPLPGKDCISPECASLVQAGWFGPEQLPGLGADEEIRAWCARAFKDIGD